MIPADTTASSRRFSHTGAKASSGASSVNTIASMAAVSSSYHSQMTINAVQWPGLRHINVSGFEGIRRCAVRPDELERRIPNQYIAPIEQGCPRTVEAEIFPAEDPYAGRTAEAPI